MRNRNQTNSVSECQPHHQTMFQYTDMTLTPSRIRNIKIEQSKQLYHNNTLPLFSPLRQLTKIILIATDSHILCYFRRRCD